MEFLNKIAFVGLISIPIIVLIHLFKQKNKETFVSSIYLWNMTIEQNQSQKSFQKIKKNLLMILQIITALFLVFAMAKPYIMANINIQNYIILLDGSMSMQSTDEKPNRFEAAKEYIEDVVEGSSPNSSFSVIFMSDSPYILINQSDDKNNILSKIKELKCTNGSINYDKVSTLLEMIYEQDNANIYSFSDNEYESELPIQNVIIGESVSNIAITSLVHNIDGDRIVSLVKVKNYSNESLTGAVNLYTDNKIHDYKEFEINADEEKNIFFTDVPIDTEEIKAVLSSDDFLTEDNTRYDIVNKYDNRKVYLSTEKNIFLENALSVIPDIEVFKGDIDNDLKGYELYVFDGVIPENMPTDGHILIFNPPIDNNFIKAENEVKIGNIYLKESNLLSFISNMDFDILESKSITTPQWGYELLSSDETPLIIAGEINSQKVIICGFELHNTDLPLKKEFPIFMYNLINWFIPKDVVSSDGIIIGDKVNFNVIPEAKELNVVSPDNEITKAYPPFPALQFESSGIYVLEQVTNEDTIYSKFAVNLQSLQESNLMRNNIKENNSSEIVISNLKVNRSLQNIFVIILLIVFAVEWWVYSHDI